MKLLKYIVVALIIANVGCNTKEIEKTTVQEEVPAKRRLAKFEPEDGKVLVFAGQDLASIGGLKEYANGYSNHFPVPAGITLYTGIGTNDGSFGGGNTEGLQGVFSTYDGGNGPSNMKLVMDDENYKNSVLAIGLSMVNSEDKVAKGELDDNIVRLAEFLKGLGERPVFLRIGYEFDGYPWNNYEREDYLRAYKRIVNILNEQGVTNTAYVWQSVGFVSNWEQLEAWYPGDEYVDWCAFSFFDRYREAIMVEFAREKGKPVFIAEASATVSDFTAKFDGQTKELILSNPEQAQEAWDKWFIPFFDKIENNSDVIKAIHYIDCNWKERPMWFENPTFQKVDARIEISPMISKKWREKMNSEMYVNASNELFSTLINNK